VTGAGAGFFTPLASGLVRNQPRPWHRSSALARARRSRAPVA
jgi:hypothetical protein